MYLHLPLINVSTSFKKPLTQFHSCSSLIVIKSVVPNCRQILVPANRYQTCPGKQGTKGCMGNANEESCGKTVVSKWRNVTFVEVR